MKLEIALDCRWRSAGGDKRYFGYKLHDEQSKQFYLNKLSLHRYYFFKKKSEV